MRLSFIPFPKASKETFQSLFLAALPFVLFLQIGRFIPVMLKDPQPPSFMVHPFLLFPRIWFFLLGIGP